ncbi:unnamed protein product [Phyllotreta striolata]|uniref:Carboxylic ester hydrolase n=1 Tax=Phyllotreta striolata TaxID=444603 RepID=A0A9N9TXH9_PHYSR|nr:unnamed protein product [Phyllotreta striolata]
MLQCIKILVNVFLLIPVINTNLVEVHQGKILGHKLTTWQGKPFYAYQEIPYAAPPIGNRRFKDPAEPQKWTGILNATRNTKMCIQPIPQQDLQDLQLTEDCLYINVYTPVSEINPINSLPVLVWIHGGAFTFESGTLQYYDPKYLMDYDIIVVTFNYRLGVFGFLATSDGTIPGNFGLKDQLMAIRWVNKNIHLFGGDKNRVTVMGDSAGAMSASYMQHNPLTKGLVKGYILGCGTSLSPASYQRDPDHFAFKLARLVDRNFNSTKSSDLLKLLRRVSAREIARAPVDNDRYFSTLSKVVLWAPVLERKHTVESLRRGEFDRVPILMGTVGEEAFNLLPDREALLQEARKFDRSKGIINPKLDIPARYYRELSRLYKSIYTNGTFEENIRALITFIGEDEISTPAIHYAALASKFTPVYFWVFSYKGLMGRTPANFNAPGHTDELQYIFGGKSGLRGTPADYPKADRLVMARLLKLWTNFVKYQNPTPVNDELLEGIQWPKVNSRTMQYLDINNTLSIKRYPKHYKEVKEIFCKYSLPLQYNV